MVNKITPAKMAKTCDQFIIDNRYSADGGPKICPAEPAAVAIANAIERFSSDDARPTTARTTPKPVPAMPKPTRMDNI